MITEGCALMAVLLYILSVNLDSLGVGISYGIRKIHIPCGASVLIALCSVFYAAAAIFSGSLLTRVFPPWLGKALGSGILFALGAWTCVSAFRPDTQKKRAPKTRSFAIRPLGLTISIARDPVVCDFDGSRRIDPGEALYLALALSLDSIGVGIGAGLSGIGAWFLPPLIGLLQFAFLTLGSLLGKRLRQVARIPHQFWTVLSGALFLLLALLRACAA